MRKLFKKVPTHHILHLPRLKSEITIENIESLPTLYNESILEQDNFGMGRINIMFRMGKEDVYDPETQVQVRLICGGFLPISPTDVMTGESEQVFKRKGIFGCGVAKKKKVNTNSNIDTLIIHIHGGGFISQSSFSHQIYTRHWAKAYPNAVIFSIDYRLSPKSRFPGALDDCWQAYTWLIQNVKKLFSINFNKVILAGDSAGGALAISLTLMTIKRKFRVPDALMPIYPATEVSRNCFWPSILNSFDDAMLSAQFLLMVLDSYHP